MNRAVVCALTLATLFAVAPTARAQEPPRTKEIKEAEKFITTALITPDTAEKRSRLERALNPLQIAMTKDAGNARVWLLAGQVYAGLRDIARADSALRKAEQMYPPFADDINGVRIAAWGDVFNKGVTLMDAQKYDEAIATFEGAEKLYARRPESKVNLGALYANKGDIIKAEEAFRAAWAITDGPEKEKLKPEEAAQWRHYTEIAKSNVAQMEGQLGVKAFEEQNYDDAIAAFRKAHELNPSARDYSYNLAQSMFAKAARMETQRSRLLDEQKAALAKKDAATAKAKADSATVLRQLLIDAYSEVEPLAILARKSDPNNEDLFLLQARSYRIRGELASDAAQKADYMKRVDELLTLHDAMQFELTNVMVMTNPGEAVVKGMLHNRKLTAGAPVKIHFTLLALDGSMIAEQDITITAPAVNADAPFETTVKTTGDVAAWKYAVAQ